MTVHHLNDFDDGSLMGMPLKTEEGAGGSSSSLTEDSRPTADDLSDEISIFEFDASVTSNDSSAVSFITKKTAATDEETVELTNNVSFDRVFVREYDVCLGDNPSCCDHMPLSLDWGHSAERTWTIDQFEAVKAMFPFTPRDGRSEQAHKMTKQQRCERLINVGGYSREQVMRYESGQVVERPQFGKLQDNIIKNVVKKLEKLPLSWLVAAPATRRALPIESDENLNLATIHGKYCADSNGVVEFKEGQFLFVRDPSNDEMIAVKL